MSTIFTPNANKRYNLHMRVASISCFLAVSACSGQPSTADAGDASVVDANEEDVGEAGVADQDAAPPCAPNMDFSSDSLNCGSCGKSCLGGTCTAGKCGPVDIGSDLSLRLTADATGVYWPVQGSQQINFTDGAVRFVGLKDSKPTDLWTGSTSPVDVSVDANKIYFVTMGAYANNTFTGGTAYSCPKTGCNGAPQALGATGDGFSSTTLIANNSQNVYWSNRTSNSTLTVPKSGGGASMATNGIGGWLQASDTALYMSGGMQVNRAVLPMGMLMTIGMAAGNIYPLIMSSKALFVCARPNNNSIEIQMCPLPDCNGGPQTLYNSDDINLQAIAAENDTLYFSERGGITACKVASCATSKVTIVPQPMKYTKVSELAVASGVLYYEWGDGGPPHVTRLVL